jgi:hypothetical protein
LPDASDATVRELARQILARPEYAAATGVQAKAQTWMLRALDRILHWFSGLQVLRASSPLLYWTIVLAIAAVCAGLIAHVAWTLWIAMTAPDPAPAQRAPSANFPNLEREAEALAAGGRYLDAAHRLMLASFRTLAERSVIELRPDRSNRWIRAALRGSALAESLALEIDGLVERTERRWFGDRARDRIRDSARDSRDSQDSRDSKDDPEIYARWRAAFAQLSSQTK